MQQHLARYTPTHRDHIQDVNSAYYNIASKYAYPVRANENVIDTIHCVVKDIALAELEAFNNQEASKLMSYDEVTAARSADNSLEHTGRNLMREKFALLGLKLEDAEKLSSVDSLVSVDASCHPDLARRFPGEYPVQDKVVGHNTGEGYGRIQTNMRRSINKKWVPYAYGERDGPGSL